MTQIDRLLSPRPDGAIDAARKFGIDVTLLAERLRRTPEERLRDLQDVMRFHEKIRGAARGVHDPARRDAGCSGPE